mmetsp:Transcript_123689/g.355235  ORF Transcript_123689/g.355235 Transcript_123689/m.355235 type:complete len:144 (+) Transcript_123689:455-886(+)
MGFGLLGEGTKLLGELPRGSHAKEPGIFSPGTGDDLLGAFVKSSPLCISARRRFSSNFLCNASRSGVGISGGPSAFKPPVCGDVGAMGLLGDKPKLLGKLPRGSPAKAPGIFSPGTGEGAGLAAVVTVESAAPRLRGLRLEIE